MPFPMTGSALYDRIVVGYAGFLRGFGNTIDITADSYDRFAGSPPGYPGRRDPGDILLDRKTIFLQDIGEVPRSFRLLESQFPETKDHIYHLLAEYFFLIDLYDQLLLKSCQLFGR